MEPVVLDSFSRTAGVLASRDADREQEGTRDVLEPVHSGMSSSPNNDDPRLGHPLVMKLEFDGEVGRSIEPNIPGEQWGNALNGIFINALRTLKCRAVGILEVWPAR
jgi:hypothetical protein